MKRSELSSLLSDFAAEEASAQDCLENSVDEVREKIHAAFDTLSERVEELEGLLIELAAGIHTDHKRKTWDIWGRIKEAIGQQSESVILGDFKCDHHGCPYDMKDIPPTSVDWSEEGDALCPGCGEIGEFELHSDREPCDHEYGIDGLHSNQFCKKCFEDKPGGTE